MVSRPTVAFTGFLCQGDNHEPFVGDWQYMPLVWLIFKRDHVFFVVHNHPVASHVIDAKQGTGVIASFVK